MRPRPEMNDCTYMGSSNTKAFCYLALRQFLSCCKRTYLAHFFLSQFREPVSFSGRCTFCPRTRVTKPSLLQRILRVIFCCAQKQMTRIAAMLHVAMMKNEQAALDCTVCEFVGDAMSRRSFSSDLVLSVAGVFNERSLPQPAFIWTRFFHPSPKSVGKRRFSIPSHFGSKQTHFHIAFTGAHS